MQMNLGISVWKYTQNERKKEENNIEDDLFTTPQFLIIIIFAPWRLLHSFCFTVSSLKWWKGY